MSETPDEVIIPAGALASSSVRVDTWLWATRQLKSRSQATAAVRAGHVRVNGEPVKAAYKVRVGDEVRLRIEGFDRILGVVLLLSKRVSYPQARTAYDDRTPERPRLHIPVAMRERGSGRPTKKERRELDRLPTNTTERIDEARAPLHEVVAMGGLFVPLLVGLEWPSCSSSAAQAETPPPTGRRGQCDQGSRVTRSGRTS